MDYAERLLAWFDINKREMPWRNTNDPYAIWVSEIMLQQTQVDTVIPYYERFIDRFPTIHSLASASLEEVYTYWQGLGYYRRAENLHKGARMIDEVYGGVFPTDSDLIKKIPGIGPYTLGAILSIAFHKPIPAVDGNVMRILARQFLIEEDVSIAKNRKIFDERVMALMPSDPNRFNQALMELGALVCTPKNPKCTACPVQTLCGGYQTGVAENYPVKSKKVNSKTLYYYVIIFKKEQSYYMVKRPEEGLLANTWGFVMLDKTVFDNIKHQLLLVKPLNTVRHVFTHLKWEMKPLLVSNRENEMPKETMDQISQGRFVTLAQMEALPIATAFKKVIEQIPNR
ncbi:A/G-specific adenine glycosylase [Cellulosilyticum sp. I15G10I2]|uniref:A/G-specific adenine glycosylase n=1 Tax=Cellulosilyticum sp. I15G10I2 TaxID=1892843 RepID=UPI00085BB1C1|nr:A/G-specific adenine glycosylase [Cellulosilyticum sp. I15G10I2]